MTQINVHGGIKTYIWWFNIKPQWFNLFVEIQTWNHWHLRSASESPLSEENEQRPHAEVNSTESIQLVFLPSVGCGHFALWSISDASSICLWNERKRYGMQEYMFNIKKQQHNFVSHCSIYIRKHHSQFKIRDNYGIIRSISILNVTIYSSWCQNYIHINIMPVKIKLSSLSRWVL